MAGTFEFDETSFPLVVATFRGPVTVEAVEAYFLRLDACFRRRARFAIVFDIAGVEVPSPSVRKAFTDATGARGPSIARWFAGVAVVLTSAVLRGTVTAFGWIQPPEYPLVVVATLGEAREMCKKWLNIRPSMVPVK